MRAMRRWLPEMLVLVLLAAAVASWRFDLGARWWGLGPDPVTQPAQVEPPARLALPTAPRARQVAAAAHPGTADPAKVSAAITPLLRPRVLGPHFSAMVANLSDGRVVYSSGGPTMTPASTLKVLTSTAALDSIGPSARFRTSTRWDAATGQLVLVGGGDPLLASSPATAHDSYPARADITTLATSTATALKGEGVARVRLRWDDTLFTGPSVNPAWPATYLPEYVVPPISALWVDEGHAAGGYRFVSDPSRAATQVFAAALRANGVRVAPRLAPMSAASTMPEVAHVTSAPLDEIIEHTLAVSDNEAAEVIGRHVGLAVKQEGSFAAGAAGVREALQRLGVDTSGVTTYDGSGLSRQNVVTPQALVQTLRLAADPAHPRLRAILTGLPVAGFTGSLRSRFANGPADARGRVRAKTGTLTGVHALAGVTVDADGTQMVFVFDADRVKPLQSLQSQTLVDRIAGALGACRCGVGSAP